MRTIVFYLICFLLMWRILDYHKLVDNAIPTTMSRLTPDVDYFSQFIDSQGPYDRLKLMDCIYYHKAVAGFFDIQRSDAYGMLGFCYERLGQESQAVASYKQALSINPYYFWSYYDLGVMAYHHAQYARAGKYFHEGIEQDPARSMVFLNRSKVYNDVKLSQREGGPYDFLQGLNEGRAEACLLMMDSFYKSEDYVQLWNAALNGIKEGWDRQGIFYYYAGMAAFHQKLYPQALEFLQIAIQKDPRNVDALLCMGMCLKAAGKTDIAQSLMDKAAQLHEQGVDEIGPYLKAQVRFF